MTAVLLDQEVERVTGKGAGAKDEVYKRKVEAIKRGIARNKPNKEDVVDVLAKVGGLDLCGLVGVFLACSYHKKLVVIDGFIAATAALLAYKLNPTTKDYMIASHKSYESGMNSILEAIGLEPHFDLYMRLGEGSGCPICFNLIDMACHTLLTMGTFEEAHVDRSAYENLWK